MGSDARVGEDVPAAPRQLRMWDDWYSGPGVTRFPGWPDGPARAMPRPDAALAQLADFARGYLRRALNGCACLVGFKTCEALWTHHTADDFPVRTLLSIAEDCRRYMDAKAKGLLTARWRGRSLTDLGGRLWEECSSRDGFGPLGLGELGDALSRAARGLRAGELVRLSRNRLSDWATEFSRRDWPLQTEFERRLDREAARLWPHRRPPGRSLIRLFFGGGRCEACGDRLLLTPWPEALYACAGCRRWLLCCGDCALGYDEPGAEAASRLDELRVAHALSGCGR